MLEINREAIKTERKIQRAAEEWQAQGKPREEKGKGYFLEGVKLGEAEEFLEEKVEIVPLSGLAREFVEESRKERDRLQKKRDRQRRFAVLWLSVGLIGALLLSGGITWQWQVAQINEIKALNTVAESLLNSSQNFDALIQSLQVGKKLQKVIWVNKELRNQVFGILQLSVYIAKKGMVRTIL